MLVFLAYSGASCILLDRTYKGRVSKSPAKETPVFEKQKSAEHLSEHTSEGQVSCAALLTRADYLGVIIYVLLEVYCTFLHPLLLPGFTFWPLLQTSLSCSVGLIWVWVDLWTICW